MRQGIDYKYSFSPTASTDSIRIVIAVSAAIHNIFYVLDIKNAHYTILVEAAERIFLSFHSISIGTFIAIAKAPKEKTKNTSFKLSETFKARKTQAEHGIFFSLLFFAIMVFSPQPSTTVSLLNRLTPPMPTLLSLQMTTFVVFLPTNNSPSSTTALKTTSSV